MPKAEKKKNPYVYGLDIGTRSIVGTVGYRQKDRFIVIAQEVKEHESRAMLDGQIHDIGAVAETIKEVTEHLVERIGEPLNQVCIAAAGRVLKTVNVHVDMPFDAEKVIEREDVYTLDSYGIEKAYEVFAKEYEEDSDMKFYCVGYSVVHYYMNGYQISNLESHKAREISADLIATFLPDDVVDGLYKAVELAGLEVANLTLEPIAAIELAIPEMYRMLNIALIDVGAGTSDISITKDGAIVAYGMLPIAGDCLTEDIARHCLVDFATAEEIKRGIGRQDTVEYQDIMGLPQKITAEEVLACVQDHLDDMATQAADKIKELNGGKPVSAVFVVGGGGKIATYTDRVAEELGIPKERCAVRGEEVMQKIDFTQSDAIKDSLMVTPIGICLNYYEQSNNFIFVNFNGERIKLYDNNHLAIVDAAIMAEFSNDDLFPKRGESLIFTLNGKETTIRGGRGESAAVYLNQKEADIHTPIRNNDVIKVEPSTVGEAAHMKLSDLPDYKGNLTIFVDDMPMTLPKLATVNGKRGQDDYDIADGDDIELKNYYTVAEVLEFMDIDASLLGDITINQKSATLKGKVYDNFILSFSMEKQGKKKRDEKKEADADRENVVDAVDAADENDVSGDDSVVTSSAASIGAATEDDNSAYYENLSRTYAEQVAAANAAYLEEAPARGLSNTVSLDGMMGATASGIGSEVTSASANDGEDGESTAAPSALEKALADTEKMVTQMEYERAEDALAQMIQNAMSGAMGGGVSATAGKAGATATRSTATAGKAGAATTAIPQPAIDYKDLGAGKNVRELYGNLQSNLNRLKSGTDIVELRDEAIASETGSDEKLAEANSSDKAAEAKTNAATTTTSQDGIVKIQERPRKVETEETAAVNSSKSDVDDKLAEANAKDKAEAIKPAAPTPTLPPSSGPDDITVFVNDAPVHLTGKPDYIYVDVFQYIDFDLSRPQGTMVETEINGRKAQYTEPLHHGDKLAIYWVK